MSDQAVEGDLWDRYEPRAPCPGRRRSPDGILGYRRLGERTVPSGREVGVAVVAGWVARSEGVYGRYGPWSKIRRWKQAAA